ncbi:hypothetical protein DPMN_100338, partial [Dreissena polymorpha]
MATMNLTPKVEVSYHDSEDGKSYQDSKDGKEENVSYKVKHSSGDLHSRLKTRKLLGVGETDDGDVHRSK